MIYLIKYLERINNNTSKPPFATLKGVVFTV